MSGRLLSFVLLLAAGAGGSVAAPGVGARDIDARAAAEFTRFFDATIDLPMTQRVAAFHRRVAVQFAAFYDPGRAGTADGAADMDARIAATEARRRESFAQLAGVLDSSDDTSMGALFMSGDDHSGLPARRGYYLGLLLARELGRSRTLSELAGMPMHQAEGLLREAIARNMRE
jgi:hypothetical protein